MVIGPLPRLKSVRYGDLDRATGVSTKSLFAIERRQARECPMAQRPFV